MDILLEVNLEDIVNVFGNFFNKPEIAKIYKGTYENFEEMVQQFNTVGRAAFFDNIKIHPSTSSIELKGSFAIKFFSLLKKELQSSNNIEFSSSYINIDREYFKEFVKKYIDFNPKDIKAYYNKQKHDDNIKALSSGRSFIFDLSIPDYQQFLCVLYNLAVLKEFQFANMPGDIINNLKNAILKNI